MDKISRQMCVATFISNIIYNIILLTVLTKYSKPDILHFDQLQIQKGKLFVFCFRTSLNIILVLSVGVTSNEDIVGPFQPKGISFCHISLNCCYQTGWDYLIRCTRTKVIKHRIYNGVKFHK
jgi:hypothetical protein